MFFSAQLHPQALPSMATPPSDTSHRTRRVLIAASSSLTESWRWCKALGKSMVSTRQVQSQSPRIWISPMTWPWFWGCKGNVSGETEVVNHWRWRFFHDLSTDPCFMNRQGELWPKYLYSIQIIYIHYILIYPPAIKCGNGKSPIFMERFMGKSSKNRGGLDSLHFIATFDDRA